MKPLKRYATTTLLEVLSVFAVLPLLVAATGDAHATELAPDAQSVDAQPPEYQIVHRRVPTLKNFKLVNLNTDQISSRVDLGQPVRLPFASQEHPGQIVNVSFKLSPHPITHQTTGLVIHDLGDGQVQTEQVPLPPRREFVGRAQGATNSLAGFSITPERVQGAAMLPLAEAGYSGWSFVEPIAPLLRRNGATSQEIQRVLQTYNHVVYSSAGIQTDQPIDPDEARGQEPPDTDAVRAGHGAGVNIVSETVSIYLMGDVDFVNDNGGDVFDAFDAQELLALWVELITSYDEPGVYGNGEFDIDLDITGQALWVSGGPISTDPSTILEEGYNDFPWSAIATPVDDIGLVHLFTGKNLDGNVIGKAWKIGGFDDPCGTSYSTGAACKQSVAEWQFGGSTYYEQIILMAHEIGHNLDAVHSDYDPNYCAGSLCGPTIMKSGISPSQVPYYSATNAAAIAAKVDAECASDPC